MLRRGEPRMPRTTAAARGFVETGRHWPGATWPGIGWRGGQRCEATPRHCKTSGWRAQHALTAPKLRHLQLSLIPSHWLWVEDRELCGARHRLVAMAAVWWRSGGGSHQYSNDTHKGLCTLATCHTHQHLGPTRRSSLADDPHHRHQALLPQPSPHPGGPHHPVRQIQWRPCPRRRGPRWQICGPSQAAALGRPVGGGVASRLIVQ